MLSAVFLCYSYKIDVSLNLAFLTPAFGDCDCILLSTSLLNFAVNFAVRIDDADESSSPAGCVPTRAIVGGVCSVTICFVGTDALEAAISS